MLANRQESQDTLDLQLWGLGGNFSLEMSWRDMVAEV